MSVCFVWNFLFTKWYGRTRKKAKKYVIRQKSSSYMQCISQNNSAWQFFIWLCFILFIKLYGYTFLFCLLCSAFMYVYLHGYCGIMLNYNESVKISAFLSSVGTQSSQSAWVVEHQSISQLYRLWYVRSFDRSQPSIQQDVAHGVTTDWPLTSDQWPAPVRWSEMSTCPSLAVLYQWNGVGTSSLPFTAGAIKHRTVEFFAKNTAIGRLGNWSNLRLHIAFTAYYLIPYFRHIVTEYLLTPSVTLTLTPHFTLRGLVKFYQSANYPVTMHTGGCPIGCFYKAYPISAAINFWQKFDFGAQKYYWCFLCTRL